jgi:anti-sigma B factor antagonist
LIEETRDGDIAVLRPTVRQLNASVAPRLHETMERLVQAGRRHVILDLQHVEFVDSTALGVIVACLKLVTGQGALMLCGARDTVRAKLEVTRMDRVLRTFPDEAAAKQAMLRTVA